MLLFTRAWIRTQRVLFMRTMHMEEHAVIEISTILMCSREGSLYMIWIRIFVCQKVQGFNYLTHFDSNPNLSRSRMHNDLNLHDFWKSANFDGNFNNPYSCVNKQNIKNINPSHPASLISRFYPSNAFDRNPHFFHATDIFWLEHAQFWGYRDFEQQYLPSLFAHDI